jgi:hypothetical protein
LPPEQRPKFVVELSESGLIPGRGLDGRADVPSPSLDPTATLFRFAADWLPREPGARFHAVAFDHRSTHSRYPIRR